MLSKAKTWHAGLSTSAKVVLWAVTAVIAGSAISGSASHADDQVASRPTNTPAVQESVKAQEVEVVTTKKNVTETTSVAFTKTTVNDANLAKGKSETRTAGANGVKTLTYEITTKYGKEIDKKLVKEEVTIAPVTEITAIGTYVYTPPKSSCDPNYSGCVPIASDVDCAGGSGNGPAYVRGPVRVIGSDIYDLDRDGDGVGCD